MISFILSYKAADQFREENIKFVLKRIEALPIEKQIIVVEQGVKQTFFKEGIEVIFVNDPGLFYKSFLYNLGALNAKYAILFFHDIDLVVSEDVYLTTIKDIQENDVVDPYGKVVYVGNIPSAVILAGFDVIVKNPIKIQDSSVISGGCFCIKKDVFIQVGGFPEQCIGYGHEDTVFDIKLKIHKCKIKRNLSYSVIHLWHTPQLDEKRNLPIFKAYKRKCKA